MPVTLKDTSTAGVSHPALRVPASTKRKAKRRRAGPVDVVREAINTLDGRISGMVEQGAEGSLDLRDPAVLQTFVDVMTPVVEWYFRGEVRHLDRIPEERGVMCVGNHSGGVLIPDSWVLMVEFVRHFGTERVSYALAHNLVLGLPIVGNFLRKVGTIPAHPQHAREALRRGAAVLVYPGGDEDTLRPWSKRNQIHLGRRTGFIRLALEERVPIVPVVSIGGHETLFGLNDGRRTAQLLHLDRFRLKSLPLVIAPPWGVSPGDLLLHIPLPAKITTEVGEPIDFHKEYGELDPHDPDVLWACYALVEHRMQAMLDKLASERRFPIIG